MTDDRTSSVASNYSRNGDRETNKRMEEKKVITIIKNKNRIQYNINGNAT